MSSGYSSRIWICPFFRWDEKRKIHCEGGAAAFQDAGTFDRYARRYCASMEGWKRCSLAAALLDQYERK